MNNHSDIAIELKNISKKYTLFSSKKDKLKEVFHPLKKKYHHDFFALKSINLEIRKGEVLGIVGKNGSGKSTLLKLISGVLTPSTGNLVVNGSLVALLELGAGFNPEFTGLENIYFYSTLLGYKRSQIDAIVDDILDFSELGAFIYQPLKTYSSGMRARLGFAVSVNVDPDILILDEVLAVGDELFQRKCYAKMEKFFKGGKTILFVSHSVQSINELCTRAVLLDSGEVILEGPVKLVTMYYQKYLFTEKGNEQKVRQELVELNRNNELKGAVYEEARKRKDLHDAISIENKEVKLIEHDGVKADITEKIVTDIFKQKPYYIADLKPKSTIEYKNQDVRFSDVEIKTADERKVNVLIMEEEYLLSYKVMFNINATDVVFSYAIKNEKGLFINTGTTLDIIPISEVKIGDNYLVEWRFTCMLVPGTYYLNVGIRSLAIESKSGLLNRIADALAFKVIHADNRKLSGIVSLNQQPNIFYLYNDQDKL